MPTDRRSRAHPPAVKSDHHGEFTTITDSFDDPGDIRVWVQGFAVFEGRSREKSAAVLQLRKACQILGPGIVVMEKIVDGPNRSPIHVPKVEAFDVITAIEKSPTPLTMRAIVAALFAGTPYWTDFHQRKAEQKISVMLHRLKGEGTVIAGYDLNCDRVFVSPAYDSDEHPVFDNRFDANQARWKSSSASAVSA